MKIRSYEGELRGFEGDIYYTVMLKEDRKIVPRQIDVAVVGATIQAVSTVGPENRPAVASTTVSPATYTVVSGDSLSLIGKRLGIPWSTIYANNKGVVGPDPNKIYPGQVYNL
ncbi:MAG: LysM peptidoglycan-binding domain-containing protein [Desulfosporosinus sp.]|nr:LysM peptidoglycan-binding domain-containing protein [Desulfosporosinus sp.]